MSYEPEQLQNIIEGALLAAGEPLSLDRLAGLFEEHEAPEREELQSALDSLAASCAGRGFQLKEVASGYRFQVREDLATWVNRLWEEKPQKYSRAMLETLALIAYRQPITRGDIEEVRGVAVSSHIIKTLTEREWVKVVGHRDVPGRPALYATTRQFLDYFNLKSLDELPTLGELRDIDSLNETLEFDALPPEIQEKLNPGAESDAGDEQGIPVPPVATGEGDDTGTEEGASEEDSDDGSQASLLADESEIAADDAVEAEGEEQETPVAEDSGEELTVHEQASDEQASDEQIADEQIADESLAEEPFDNTDTADEPLGSLDDDDIDSESDDGLMDQEYPDDKEHSEEQEHSEKQEYPDENRDLEEEYEAEISRADPDYSHDSLFGSAPVSSDPEEATSGSAADDTQSHDKDEDHRHD